MQEHSELGPEVDLSAEGISLRFDPDCGMVRALSIVDGGRDIRPMHRAPWIGEAMPQDAPRHLARLEGDFFCMPFADGGGSAPVLHGWPANGRWQVRSQTQGTLCAVLESDGVGRRVEKQLSLRDGQPFLYQRHCIQGGAGSVSAANHAMVSLPAGGRLSFSAKRGFVTPDGAPEPDAARGRSALAYPATAAVPSAFPGADGSMVDLTRYPWGPRHEDFVVGLEAPGTMLGWTAVVRVGQGDVFLSLRDARQLPMTMLWHSNGGRDYAPWSGRHMACLGVEEGLAPHVLGDTGGFDLSPGGVVDIRHAIGAIAWPDEDPVISVEIIAGGLRVTGEGGTSRELPFDIGHLFPG